MIEDVSTALSADSKNENLISIAKRVNDITRAKIKIAEIELQLTTIWNDFNTVTNYDKA
jgi:hypothetical protein